MRRVTLVKAEVGRAGSLWTSSNHGDSAYLQILADGILMGQVDVRARWAALLDCSLGELAPQTEGESRSEVVRMVRPDTRVEERQVFRKLVGCVLTGIRRLDAIERTRGYLLTLW